jgi:hypothetical protein
MVKKLEDLNKEELIAIKTIVNNYPLTSKLMIDIKKNPDYKDVIDILRVKIKKEKEFNNMIKKEMEDYKSPDEKYINNHLNKSLSYNKNNTKITKSTKKLSNNINYSIYNDSPVKYLNDDEYKEYDEKYKQNISRRSKSLEKSINTISINTNNLHNEEDIIDNLILFMDKYFYPGNIIKYLSMLDKRFCDFNELCDYGRFKIEDDYKCGTIHNNIFLYNFLNILDIKCLYICFHNGKHYISPLNDKRFLNFIQTKNNLPYDNMLEETENYNKYADTIQSSLNRILSKFKKVYYNDSSNKLEIPCELYDIVIKHNMFNYDFEINTDFEVKLLGINNKKFVSSIINNSNHSISIIKINDKKYFNPSYETGIKETYRMYEYVPLFNENYHLEKDHFANINHEMIKINSKDIDDYDNRELYNSRFMYNLNKSIYAYTGDNLHIFSNRHKLRKQKIYKIIEGGTNNISLYIPPNKHGFCWYSSIISSIFYADEISIIMLNKSIRYIKKSIDLLIQYNNDYNNIRKKTIINYNIYEKDKENIINLMIYINTFIYTSYASIIKNKINEITDIKNWLLCLKYIFDNENVINIWNDILLTITNIEWKSIK